MEIFGIVVIITVAGFLLLRKRLRRGIFRDKDSLKQSLDQLLNQMHEGFLIFTHAKSEKFLQFTRYQRENNTGITLGFPIVSWSEPYEKAMKIFCENNGINIAESFGSDNTKFIDIDFGHDTESANNFIISVFSEVLKAPPEDGFHVFLDGKIS